MRSYDFKSMLHPSNHSKGNSSYEGAVFELTQTIQTHVELKGDLQLLQHELQRLETKAGIIPQMPYFNHRATHTQTLWIYLDSVSKEVTRQLKTFTTKPPQRYL